MSVEKRTAELFKDLCDAPTGSVKDDMTIGKLSDSHTDLFIRIIAGHLAANNYEKRVEGEWILTKEYNAYRMRNEYKVTCSVCGHKPKYEGYLSDMNYCNKCGAIMKDGGDT